MFKAPGPFGQRRTGSAVAACPVGPIPVVVAIIKAHHRQGIHQHMRIMSAALGVVTAGATLFFAAPASAQVRDVEFSYSPPVISEEGDRVVWNWTAVNRDSRPATKVVITHRTEPLLTVSYVSWPCAVDGEKINCRWDSIQPGQEVRGIVEADLSPGLSGSVRISGRVVWQRAAMS